MLSSTELQQFIEENRNEDVKKLALRYSSYLGQDLNYVMTQISGWQRCRKKIPSWSTCRGLQFPIQLSMEQCSSESTAKFKSRLIQGDSFVDLTGGFGVDCAFISKGFKKAIYVERNRELAEIVLSNYLQLGLNNISVEIADSVEFLEAMSPVSVIYLDPARRDDYGRKMVSILDCTPDLTQLKDLLFEKTSDVWVKYSPMLDISLAVRELVDVEDIYVVSVENECKELLFHLKKFAKENPVVHCINIQKEEFSQFEFTYQQEQTAPLLLSQYVYTYLYEPNSSLLKAGCYKSLCSTYSLRKLDVNSHLYTSENLISDFPGRIFKVEQCSTLNKKELKSFLLGVEKANVTLRNFPMSVDEFRKKTKIKDGGELYLFGTMVGGVNTLIKSTKVIP